jgi:hypothetical protein
VLLVPAQQHRNAAPAPAEVWTGVVRSDRDLWLLSVHGNVRAGLLVRAWLLSESPRPVPQGVWMRWGGVRGTPWAPYPNLNPPLYLAGEQQSVATPHAVRGWSHHPADTSRSNLAAAWALVQGGGPNPHLGHTLKPQCWCCPPSTAALGVTHCLQATEHVLGCVPRHPALTVTSGSLTHHVRAFSQGCVNCVSVEAKAG